MREVWATTQFKKDFKRFKNNKAFVGKLMALVKLLADDQPIPPAYGPHPLTGNWKNYMECHIESDCLLIWYDKEKDVLELVRLGSHSELFGNGRKK